MAPPEEMLQPGRAYRTRDLQRWDRNGTRLARRLVNEGRLAEAAHGIYYAPVPSKFGPGPASDEELLRAFLNDEPFVVTGPPYWNALDLGATALFAETLVYNMRRTGVFLLAGRRFRLRRVYFPEKPTPEWFIIDLLQHHDMAGAALSELQQGLTATLKQGRWNRRALRSMARKYGTAATAAAVDAALAETQALE